MRMQDGMRMNKEGGWDHYLDGAIVTEAAYRKRYPVPESRPGDIVGGTPTKGWPMKSLALAVHPEQVDEANARNKQHGVNVSYDPQTGAAIIPDRAARGRLLKQEKYIDRDSFTGN